MAYVLPECYFGLFVLDHSVNIPGVLGHNNGHARAGEYEAQAGEAVGQQRDRHADRAQYGAQRHIARRNDYYGEDEERYYRGAVIHHGSAGHAREHALSALEAVKYREDVAEDEAECRDETSDGCEFLLKAGRGGEVQQKPADERTYYALEHVYGYQAR